MSDRTNNSRHLALIRAGPQGLARSRAGPQSRCRWTVDIPEPSTAAYSSPLQHEPLVVNFINIAAVALKQAIISDAERLEGRFLRRTNR